MAGLKPSDSHMNIRRWVPDFVTFVKNHLEDAENRGVSSDYWTMTTHADLALILF
jgi:hypothetical protein